MGLIAFFNDPKLQRKFLDRVIAHAKADEIVKGAIEAGIITATKSGQVFSSRLPGPRGTENKNGYIVFTLHFSGYRKQIKAHRAVWIYFNGKPDCNLVIDHINGVKNDNRLSNLRLVTPKENSLNRRSYKGELNPSAKINKTIADLIRKEHATGWSYQALATNFGISKTLVANIIRGEMWT